MATALPDTRPRKTASTASILVLLSGLATLALSSCERSEEPTLIVEMPLLVEDDSQHWLDLVAAHPLPQRLTVVPVTDADERAPVLRLALTVEPVLPAPAPDSELRRRPLSRRWLAPAAPVWTDAAPTGTLPLDGIDLPLTARAVDGRYPDDPEYPFVEQLVLELDLAATGLARDDDRTLALESWYERLPLDETSAPVPRWIAAVGDLMVARGVTELLDRRDGLELVFGDLLPLMRGADFLLGNLEGAVSDRGTPLEKTFTFRFPPRVLAPLAEAGFDYFSIVNNHSYDYGEVGFLDSLDHLAAAGIATSGAGRTLAQAREPYRFGGSNDSGTAIHVLSVGAYPLERSGFDGARQTAAGPERPGVLWAGPRNPKAQAHAFAAMRDAFGDESFDVVMVHGGPEWATRPPDWQRDLYRSFVDAGADLVLGHHSHVVQGLETYRGALIAHSLGNFVFPGMFVTEYGEQSVLLRIGLVDGVIRYVEPVPVRIDHQRISLDARAVVMERFLAETRFLHKE